MQSHLERHNNLISDASLEVLQVKPSGSSGKGEGSCRGGNRSGAQKPSPPSPPPLPSSKPAEQNNGYVVRPAGAEPLENHPRYERIKDINSGERHKVNANFSAIVQCDVLQTCLLPAYVVAHILGRVSMCAFQRHYGDAGNCEFNTMYSVVNVVSRTGMTQP